mmetsp:Transcript_18666/g.59291  ORF Transcript_18666/g.59291 Transcript_18666/m.59291 type:complete len:447 (+) Transcript_18666:489-1829(+)
MCPPQDHPDEPPQRQEPLLAHIPVRGQQVQGWIHVGHEAESCDGLDNRFVTCTAEFTDKGLHHIGFLFALPLLVFLETRPHAVLNRQLCRKQLAVRLPPAICGAVFRVVQAHQVSHVAQDLRAIGTLAVAEDKRQESLGGLVVGGRPPLDLAPEALAVALCLDEYLAKAWALAREEPQVLPHLRVQFVVLGAFPLGRYSRVSHLQEAAIAAEGVQHFQALAGGVQKSDCHGDTNMRLVALVGKQAARRYRPLLIVWQDVNPVQQLYQGQGHKAPPCRKPLEELRGGLLDLLVTRQLQLLPLFGPRVLVTGVHAGWHLATPQAPHLAAVFRSFDAPRDCVSHADAGAAGNGVDPRHPGGEPDPVRPCRSRTDALQHLREDSLVFRNLPLVALGTALLLFSLPGLSLPGVCGFLAFNATTLPLKVVLLLPLHETGPRLLATADTQEEF